MRAPDKHAGGRHEYSRPGGTIGRVDETARAKVNLDLRVCSRRPDGYHDLDSFVVFADVGDRLSFEPSDRFSLTIEGPFGAALPVGDSNLVVRAAKALAEEAGLEANVRITLDKILPIAAGLGGGSADAAATLRGLTRLWRLPFGLADLAPLAQRLGADVPACLGSSAVRMQGTGDRLTSLSLPATPSFMVLANPGTSVQTSDVFRTLRAFSGVRRRDMVDAEKHDVLSDLSASTNDLEAPAIAIAPIIGSVLDALDKLPGCRVARMSGSGATCFALFDNAGERDLALSLLAAAHPDWWVTGATFQ